MTLSASQRAELKSDCLNILAVTDMQWHSILPRKLARTLLALLDDTSPAQSGLTAQEHIDGMFRVLAKVLVHSLGNSGAPAAAKALHEAGYGLLLSSPASGWRTMDSAPKDGSRFLVKQGEFVANAFYKRNNLPSAVRPETLMVMAQPDRYSATQGWLNPTHWLPLPPKESV